MPGPFSKEYEDVIRKHIDFAEDADKDAKDDDIARNVLEEVSSYKNAPLETHTWDEVVNRVRFRRKKKQVPAPPNTQGSIFGNWSRSFGNLIKSTSRSAGSIVGSFVSGATSAAFGASQVARNAYKRSGAGGSTGGGAGGGTGGVPGSTPSGPVPYSQRSHVLRRQKRQAVSARRIRARQAVMARRSGGWIPYAIKNARSHMERAAEGGQFANLMPQAQGLFGKVGGIVGTGIGAVFGGAGGAIGQAAGTIIGNFVDKMKDAVTQAHAFAVALKESNARFMYYNASIAMSYVESDISSMIRDMRIARSIAPTTVALNRSITNYEATNVPRDIFLGNIRNEWAQFTLGGMQGFAEFTKPLYERAEQVRQYLDPQGTGAGSWGRFLMRFAIGVGQIGTGWGLPEGISRIWDAFDKLWHPEKEPTPPAAKGAWDELMGSRGGYWIADGGIHFRKSRKRTDRF